MSKTIYGVEQSIWTSIFLLIFFFSFILMGGTLASKSWVYTTANSSTFIETYNDFHNNIINFRIFEGNLYRCTESCTETYKKLSSEFCDEAESLYRKYPENYFICRMFKNLNKGMKLYLICEGISMLFMLLIGLLIIFSRKSTKKTFPYIIYALLTLVIIAHYTGFISWMSVTNTNFNRDCVDIPHNPTEDLKFCAGDGPALALFITILLPLISVMFCFVSKNFGAKKTVAKIDREIKPEKKKITYLRTDVDSDRKAENKKLSEGPKREQIIIECNYGQAGIEMQEKIDQDD